MIETRPNTGARPQGATHGSQVRPDRRPRINPGSLVARREVRTVLVGSALTGLLGATACAVASFSIWLVPAYLLLVAAILTAPRGKGTSSQATGSPPSDSGPSSEARSRDHADDPTTGEGGSPPEPDAGPEPSALAAAIADDPPSSLRADPAATVIPRPRKSRSRSRKATKAAEPTTEPAPVTWVRVGPGQYVRSDAIPQGQPPAEAPAPAEDVAPEAEAPPSAAEEESATIAQPETVAPDATPLPTPDPEPAPAIEATPEVVPPAEEYGIAPSAFAPTEPPQPLLPDECREPDVADDAPLTIAVDFEPDPEPEPESVAQATDEEPVPVPVPESPARRRGPSPAFPRILPRRLAAPRLPSRVSSQSPPRRLVRGDSPRGPRRVVAARRGPGRMAHIRHPWRARSPPCPL